MTRSFRFMLSIALAATSAGCALAQPAEEPTQTESAEANAPVESALTAEALYLFLVGEVALQRGEHSVAVTALGDLARRSREPRLVRRALEVAMQVRRLDIAMSLARLWTEVEPDSPRARQALAGLMVNEGKLEEVIPHLEQLLEADGRDRAQGFMQLNRWFGNYGDKKRILVLIERLAEKYRDLPEAHFAIAQAAANASQVEHAQGALREALRLRPDWDSAVLFQAQIVQKRSNTEALELLREFLQRKPDAHEVRSNYARALVGDRRLEEARAEFETIAAAQPDNAEAVYAIGVISLQMGDRIRAESSLRRIADADIRERNSVQFYLGQIAEEKDDLDGALMWYSRVDTGDQYATARIRMANVLSRQGKLEAARQILREAEQSGEQSLQFILTEAQLLRALANPQEAP